MSAAHAAGGGGGVGEGGGDSIDSLPHFNQNKIKKLLSRCRFPTVLPRCLGSEWQTPSLSTKKRKITRHLVMQRRLKTRLYLQLGHLWHSNEVSCGFLTVDS